jgi:para-nitrobenzyl esterase
LKIPYIRAAALALAAILAGQSQAAETAKAKVESGVVVGQSDGDVAVFRAIPYVAPPVGPLRWRPPQPLAPWSGERPALANGPSCPQVMNANGTPNGGGAFGPTSEDCLTLNVFAPAKAKHAPVMVWIHGGANVVGSGSIYDGTAFAHDGVVLVAINYRMGALGFFAHPALTKAAGPSEPLANFALMDQMAALKWAARNAAAFGGDPHNITVFGESAGAMDIVALLGVPSAKGLFKRAIMESNIGWGGAVPLAQSEARGVAVAQKLGLPADASVDQLRALSVDALINGGARSSTATTIDGRMVKESAHDAFAAGREVPAPIIIGSNSYEASLIAGRGAAPSREAADAFIDGQAGAPARWIAGRFAGQPSWLYYFAYVREADRATAPGAAHASEISYVFNWLRPTRGQEPSDQDKAMAVLMHSCWVAFARTGRPTCASGPAWPAYTPQGDQLMEFGAPPSVQTHFRKAQLDAQEARQAAPRPAGASAP